MTLLKPNTSTIHISNGCTFSSKELVFDTVRCRFFFLAVILQQFTKPFKFPLIIKTLKLTIYNYSYTMCTNADIQTDRQTKNRNEMFCTVQ